MSYKQDRDEALKVTGRLFLPVLEAMDEAWGRHKMKVLDRDMPDPQRVFCRGFVAGTEYEQAKALLKDGQRND